MLVPCCLLPKKKECSRNEKIYAILTKTLWNTWQTYKWYIHFSIVHCSCLGSFSFQLFGFRNRNSIEYKTKRNKDPKKDSKHNSQNHRFIGLCHESELFRIPILVGSLKCQLGNREFTIIFDFDLLFHLTLHWWWNQAFLSIDIVTNSQTVTRKGLLE